MTTHNSAEVEATTPRPHPARHRRLLFIGCLLTILVAGGIVLRRAQDATALRESYLPELEARAKREPNYGQLQALTAGRLTEANEYASAVPYLERAVRAGENEEIVWRTWAAATAASGNREQAGVILLAAKKAVVHFSEIEAAIQRCRTLPADTSVEKLAETICPEGVRGLVSHYNQGSFLNDWSEKSGRNNPETSGFETRHAWAKEKPNDAQALRYWGEALIRNRRNVEAESVLRHTLELDPTSLDARIALANALKARGEYGKAGLEYITCLKKKKDWLPALMGLGQVALEKRMLSIGTDVFERAVKQDPNNVEAWIGLGRAHYARRLNLSRALEAFQTAAKLAPNRTDFSTNYSNALRVNFKYEEAEAVLRRRLSADTNDAQAHFLLALLQLDYKPSAERRTDAIEGLRTSLRLAPDVSATETRLAQLLVEDGKSEDAISLLGKTLKRDRNNLTGYQTLARALRKVGKRKDADLIQASANELSAYLQRTSFLEDLLQRQPGNLKSHKELLDLYVRGGDTMKAERQEEIVAVLEKDPKMAERGIKDMNAATALGTTQK